MYEQCYTSPFSKQATHLVGGRLVPDVARAEHVLERHLGDVVPFLVGHVLAVRVPLPLLGETLGLESASIFGLGVVMAIRNRSSVCYVFKCALQNFPKKSL